MRLNTVSSNSRTNGLAPPAAVTWTPAESQAPSSTGVFDFVITASTSAPSTAVRGSSTAVTGMPMRSVISSANASRFASVGLYTSASAIGLTLHTASSWVPDW